MAMSNVSVHEQEIAWEDFATVKAHKKQLQKHSKKKELSAATWARIKQYFPGFLKLHDKTPDELIEEAMIDSEMGEMRIDEYFIYLKKFLSHNSARNICYGSIQSFYSHNKIMTKQWVIPEEHPSLVKDTDDNFPVWVYDEKSDDFELNRSLFQDFFNRLSPTYRAVSFALIGTGQDIGEILKTDVGFVRNQNYQHKRLSLNGNRSKTSQIVDGFHSEESTVLARSILAAERQDADDSDPLYTTSIAQRKRQFLKDNGRLFRNDGIDVLPPAKRLTVGVVEHAFRVAQKNMGIKLVRGQQGPLRPKRLRKIYRTAADLAGLGDDKSRQLIGQSTGRISSGKYLETAREIQERTYMKVERKIWIFKEPELSLKEKETSAELRKQIDELNRQQEADKEQRELERKEDREQFLALFSDKMAEMRKSGYVPE